MNLNTTRRPVHAPARCADTRFASFNHIVPTTLLCCALSGALSCASGAGGLFPMARAVAQTATVQPVFQPLGGPSFSGPGQKPEQKPETPAPSATPATPNPAKSGTPVPATPDNDTKSVGSGVDVKRIAQGAENPDAASGAAPLGGKAEAQNTLPYDLRAVRRLKVAGQVVNDLRLVGNIDLLAPIVNELPRLGASVTRAAASNLPAGASVGADEKYFQINLPQGAPIVLTVGKEVATVNNVEQRLRAAPLVIGDKIWLPVFSIAPLLGAATRLEGDGTLNLSPTVQSVELFPVRGMLALTIKTSAPLPDKAVLMGTLEDPPKIYLDFPGYSMGFDAASSTAERKVSEGLQNVQKVRSALFQSFPDTTRIVLDLNQPMKSVVVQPTPDKTMFALLMAPPPTSSGSSMAPVMLPTGTLRGVTIVVDAGHGGHDFGALGPHSQEKDQTLDIARRVRDELQERGATVLMTRESDYFVTLQGRVDFANSRKADIFFSVHINSYRPESSGTETFYYTGQSQALAREVHAELTKATGLPNRGVTQARFLVIRKTWMPSILTETAFITNPREEALLMDEGFRQRVAQGMARGINNYVQRYMRSAVNG